MDTGLSGTICACCHSIIGKSAPFYIHRCPSFKCSWKYNIETRTRKSLLFISETFIDLRDIEIRHMQKLQSYGR